MPIITRTTNSRTTVTSVPVWVVKLITCALSIAVLFLVYFLDNGVIQTHYKTFMLVSLTVGCLLGWSVGSVLQQVLSMRHIEISINFILTCLSIATAVLCLIYVFNFGLDAHNAKLALGMTVCFIFQSIVCIIVLSWACYGHIVVAAS